MPNLEEITLLYQVENTLLYRHEDQLFLWDSTRWERPYTLANERGTALGLDYLLARLHQPSLDMSPSEAAYRRADSLAWQYNTLPFELGMQSSSLVYSTELMLTWPRDAAVAEWKIEWRNTEDQVIDSTFTEVNRVRFSLKPGEESALYLRHPLTREGSGVFVLSGMPAEERKALEAFLPEQESTNPLALMAQAAYFEQQGLRVDALSNYLKIMELCADTPFAEALMTNYFFRLGFPPLY